MMVTDRLYHEWLSYDYVSNETEAYRNQCPGLVEV